MTATAASCASSLQIVPSPPRVGSRIQRVFGRGGEQRLDELVQRCGVGLDLGLDVEVAAGHHHRHAVIAERPGRARRGLPAAPCARRELTPGRDDADARRGDVEPVGGAPRTTFVSPVTSSDAGVARGVGHVGDDLLELGDRRPSAMTNATESHCGRAPLTARSLTVPCTASWPIEPPGKRRGETTNESVLKASRSPEGSVRTAPSPSCSSSGLRNASRKTASTSAAEDLPPAPCASVMTSSISRGRRLRNFSIFCRTRSSREIDVGHRDDLVGHAAPPVRASAPMVEAALRGRPQLVAEQRLALLDAVDALRAHDEAVVDRVRLGHLAAGVTGEADGHQAAARGLARARSAGRRSCRSSRTRPRCRAPVRGR